MDKAINTNELLNQVFSNSTKIVEARLLLNGGFATHFLCFKNASLFDEGIDGKNRKINSDIFRKNYANACWIIDQII